MPVGDSTFRSYAGKSLLLNKESGVILTVIIKLYGILILIVGFLMKYRRKYPVVKKMFLLLNIIFTLKSLKIHRGEHQTDRI